MEGHGLAASEAWPALLAQEYGWRLTNLAWIVPVEYARMFAQGRPSVAR